MRKFTSLLVLLLVSLCSFSALAVDIPKGTFYFDNSKTKYQTVSFVYGAEADIAPVIVRNMEKGEGDIWKITFNEAVPRQYRYFFTDFDVETTLYFPFNEIKDTFVEQGYYRTATTNATIPVNYIFTPVSGEQWAQGEWRQNSKPSTGYYIAGDGDAHDNWCCGLYWDAATCKLTADGKYETTLSAGTYSFKITNGSWAKNWGYESFNSSQSTVECYPEMLDGNVMFTLNKASKILISFSENSGIVVTDGTAPAPVTCNPASGTLPVMYLNTDSGKEITDDENYVPATVYIDAMGIPGYESLGTKEEPLVAQTKGRGNYTWTGFDKKPYALKFDKKQTPLGLTKDKSFTLLAHADDEDAFLRNTLGFALSRAMGLAYTPGQEPFELFINGVYRGIYFLTDKIKVSSNRVQVTEQEDGETDPSLVTGGWLLEIDNYDEDESVQFRMEEKDGDILRVTSKSPEVMSEVQYNYMRNYLFNTNKTIQQKGDFEKYIDLESLVNFYIVQEVIGNHESFHGSCYMHKERGDDTKLNFGPVWDFGSSLHWAPGRHIYDMPPWGDTWIDDLAKYKSFQDQCKKRWNEVGGNLYSIVKAEADAFIDKINSAAQCDCKKWPEYGNSGLYDKKREVLNYLTERIQWLNTEWGTPSADNNIGEDGIDISVYPTFTNGVINIDGAESLTDIFVIDMDGKLVQALNPAESSWNLNVDRGLYILKAIGADGGVYTSKITVY